MVQLYTERFVQMLRKLGDRTNDLTNPEILKVCHASFIKQFYNDLDIDVEDDRGHVCAMQIWRITCRISFK